MKQRREGPSKEELRKKYKELYIHRVEGTVSYEEFDRFETELVNEDVLKKSELMELRADALHERARRDRGGADPVAVKA